MNATLEAIARALFRSWFVDFDPVRAKADGRDPPGMDTTTAALFPAAFEDSPLGKVPRGWKVKGLDEIVVTLSGGTPKTSVAKYWNGNIPWFSVVDAPDASDIFVINTEKHITQAGIDNSAAKILPEGTTIISARGTVGKLALVGVPMAMNQSCYGVKATKGYSDFFVYFLLRSVITDFQQQTHGTVFDTITLQTFKTVDIVKPPPELTQIFEKHVQPFLYRIQKNLYHTRTLAALRDTLLPKLLSGEVGVGGESA
jgi:type I restriction enzyme S subunit